MALSAYHAGNMLPRHSISVSESEMPEYYTTLGPEWSSIETPVFQSAFMGVNPPYCTESMVPSTILTPISLPDHTFHSSPVLSHQSQDYSLQDYQYGVNDSMSQPQGLGISAPFPAEFPRTTTPNAGYAYAPDDTHYGLGQTPLMSPSAPSAKHMKRTPSQTPGRETPINILPHPEGVQRMERERHTARHSPLPHPRPRAPGRGRRDPQAETEDAFVEGLRQQNLAWKVVREMFRQRFNKDASEARLQMRLLRRRKERLARWDDNDIQLLLNAHDMWESEKFQFVADKIKELGASKEYTSEQCRSQLRLLDVKQSRRGGGDTSPTCMSDPPHSPAPSLSRKRARSESEDEEEN
ncbi:hypothetical protein N7492_009015 [Penicillium capsulatum]|uniref:Myb-like domain-containing protein n=1 Tax=Penicillium capsulatum TaxID=69766 RepID=A0A9W9HSA6_9EURO|nr:hypothetical protein N7492_009015 [Penicillium capsulatum]KAJ6106413.1 hypothetical protein N7512_009930 [Penicillium capsulatum]